MKNLLARGGIEFLAVMLGYNFISLHRNEMEESRF